MRADREIGVPGGVLAGREIGVPGVACVTLYLSCRVEG